MKQSEKAKWEEIRGKGALRFILVYGVLAWGVGTAVLFTGLMWLLGGEDLARIARFSAIAFPIGGVAWGGIIWWLAERRYLGAGGGEA